MSLLAQATGRTAVSRAFDDSLETIAAVRPTRQEGAPLQKGSIAGLKQQLESEHAKAADLELAEAPVPADLQEKMEELRASIAEEEARIARLEQDRSTIQARYQFDIERFRAIRPDSR